MTPDLTGSQATGGLARALRRAWPRAAILVAVCAVFAGCARPPVVSGNQLDDARLEKIQPGQHTRDDVFDILGSPSHRSAFRGNHWYYVSRTSQQTAFFQPEVIDQRLVVVTFDPDGMVQEVRMVTMEDTQEVTPVARETPTAGDDVTIMRQLFGNLGRFDSPGQKPGSTE